MAGVRSYEVTPEEFGLKRAPLDAIAGGDAAQNAAIIRAVLEGERSPRRDVVVLNAAAALVAAGHADHIGQAVPLGRLRHRLRSRAPAPAIAGRIHQPRFVKAPIGATRKENDPMTTARWLILLGSIVLFCAGLLHIVGYSFLIPVLAKAGARSEDPRRRQSRLVRVLRRAADPRPGVCLDQPASGSAFPSALPCAHPA